MHASRMRGGAEGRSEQKMFVVERVHAKRTRGRTNEICEVERVHVRRMRGEETGEICEVERVHVKRMRGRGCK